MCMISILVTSSLVIIHMGNIKFIFSDITWYMSPVVPQPGDTGKPSSVNHLSSVCYSWVNYSLATDLAFTQTYPGSGKTFVHYTLEKSFKISPDDLKLSVNSSVSNRSVFNFLPNYRNPCWVERIPTRTVYSKSRWNTAWPSRSQMKCVKRQESQNQRRFTNSKSKVRIRCFPYVLLGGMFKAGTTDFYRSLRFHREVAEPCVKEPAHLSQPTSPFTQYLDLFDGVGESIRLASTPTGYHPKVTLDGTTGLFRGYSKNVWQVMPWNRSRSAPCVTFAQHVKYFHPSVKVIILLRRQPEWLASCYNHFRRLHHPHSASDLHSRVVTGIRRFTQCMNATKGDTWRCFNKYDTSYPCRLENTLYYVTVKHWRDILGETRLMVVKSETYFANRKSVMDKTARFLGLSPFTNAEKATLSNKRVSNRAANGKSVKMLPQTKDLLMQFVQKWNKLLAEYLSDNSFMWR